MAHRGASGIAPENTMLAFCSLDTSNTIIEMDLQLTKDNEVVLFHDRSFERFTGEKTGIADYTLLELSVLDPFQLDTWTEFRGLELPSLKDVFHHLPPEQEFILEIKPQGREIEKDFALEQKVLELIEQYDRTFKHGYISVRTEESYEYITEHSSHRCGLMQKKRTVQDFHQILQDYDIPIAQIRIGQYSEVAIDELKQMGKEIVVFYADTPREWRYLIEKEVDAIITNYPNLYQGYLRCKHRYWETSKSI